MLWSVIVRSFVFVLLFSTEGIFTSTIDNVHVNDKYILNLVEDFFGSMNCVRICYRCLS